MRYILILLVLAGMAVGAMTKDQICIEQNRFNQASTIGTSAFRGLTVWIPYNYDQNVWQGFEFWKNTVATITPTVIYPFSNKAHWRAKFYAGKYIPCVYDNATYGRPTELAFKNVAGDTDGAWTDLASRRIDSTSTGWHGAYRASTDRYVQITVPDNTTHLYMYCNSQYVAGTATVTKVSGTATLFNGVTANSGTATIKLESGRECYLLVPATVEIGDKFKITVAGGEDIEVTATAATVANVTGLWTTAWNASVNAENLKFRAINLTTGLLLHSKIYTDTMSITTSTTDGGGADTQTITLSSSPRNTPDFTDHTGFYDAGYKLIATNCGGSVIRVVKATGSASCLLHVLGWIAVNKNTAAQPDTGVFDPTELRELSQRNQDADGPVWMKITSGGTPFHYGYGGGHFTTTRNISSAVQTLKYDIDGTLGATVPTTDNTQVNTIATDFYKILAGDMYFNDGGADKDFGDFISVYHISPRGFEIDVKQKYNANATTTMDLQLDGTAEKTGGGGGITIWSLPKEFTKFKLIGDASFTSTRNPSSFVNGTTIKSGYGASAIATSNALNAAALWTGQVRYYNEAETSLNNGAYQYLLERVEAAANNIYWTDLPFIKLHCALGLLTDIDLVAGDTVECRQFRQVLPLNYLDSGSSGGGIFGGSRIY